MKTEPLTYGRFFHIYNHGNNRENLFLDPENYEYFLALYDKYISPVAETYAWVLMPNHFHLLFRIRDEDEIGFIPYQPKPRLESSTAKKIEDGTSPSEVSNPEGECPRKRYQAQRQFSHLFNAYAQAFNKKNGRSGSLFEHPFKRKSINKEDYLKRVILYIHNNPVHHGFCTHPVEYPWTSYLSCISIKPTKLKREKVIGWFDDQAIFKTAHDENVEIEKIE